MGRVSAPYGVRGWIHVAAESPDAGVLRAARQWRRVDESGGPAGLLEVEQVRRHGAGWVAKLAGVDTPEQADRLRGARVAVSRRDFPPLPEGEYYWVDLIGLAVVNREGVALGTVRELLASGPQTTLVLDAEEDGKPVERMVPFVSAFIDKVDLAGRVITVDWQPDY